MTNPLARIRSRSLRREVDALEPRYASLPTDREREEIQLELLNRTWSDVRHHVPHYAASARELALPARWSSLDEFAERVPATRRETLQSLRERLFSTQRPPESWGATGGSTAEPIRIPRWNSELQATRALQWLGRRWYGVEPDDRLFLLWGHGHLLGTGLRGWVNARRRELQDRILGFSRFSAYDISDGAMQAAVEGILSFRPAYLLGYSVALDRLERAAAAQRERLRALGIKVVIGTAENFPYADSAQRISDTFGCPVAMEYGAMEAIAIAYTHPEGGYRAFWRSFLAEAERRGERWVLRLTSLYPRSMPLVRYEIGDELELAPGSRDHLVGVTHFERLSGRCNDYVEMADGAWIHSEAFSHAVRPCAAVRGYQVVQAGGDLHLRVTASGEVSAADEQGMRRRLAIIHPDLAGVALERVDALAQTTTGKTPMIIRQRA